MLWVLAWHWPPSLFMKQASDLAKNGMEVGSVSDFDGSKPWQDEQDFYEKYKDKVIIKHLYGPLFFGFTSYFKDGIKELGGDIKALIIRMDRVPYMDQSGLYALEEAIFDLRQQDVEVIFTGLQEQPKDQMEAIDLIDDLVPHEDIFDTVDEAFSYLRSKLG